jgi:hypothetical protein
MNVAVLSNTSSMFLSESGWLLRGEGRRECPASRAGPGGKRVFTGVDELSGASERYPCFFSLSCLY